MKKNTVIRKLGILVLTAMVMTGTVMSPALLTRAAEGGTSSSAAPEEEPSGGNEGGETGGDEGGESGGNEGGESGGNEGGETGGDEGGESGGNEGGETGGDEGGETGGNEGGETGGDEGGETGGNEGGETGGNEGGESGGNEGAESGGEDASGIGSGENDAAEAGETAGEAGSAATAEAEDEDYEILEDSEIDETEESSALATTSSLIAAKTEPTKDITEEPEGYKEAENHDGTNEELLAEQHIVYDLPVIRKDFRFTTVDPVHAFSKGELEILEERSDDAEVVGKIVENGVLFELEEESDGWIYVESGKVRGFVHAEDLLRGEEAEDHYTFLEKHAERISKLLPQGLSREAYFFTAQETVPYYENDAFTFRRITAQKTVIEKVPGLAKEDIAILEEQKEDARVTGTLGENDIAYVISETPDGWLFVESGDVRGFVKKDALDRSKKAQEKISEEGEDSFTTASEKIKPEDNKATYFTTTSIKEGAKYNEVREKILDLALSCVGNPYVWGGTSLTNGADCSGFVQTLYSRFGYHLPRVAAAQSRFGTQIPVSDAAPGDLIFFARNGYVYHVAMYAGDGKTVEAYSSNYGIITKELSERNAVWATRVIED